MQRYSPVLYQSCNAGVATRMEEDPNGQFVKYADVQYLGFEDIRSEDKADYYLLANNYVRDNMRLRKEVADLKQLNIVLHDMLKQEYADNYARNEYSYARNGGDDE